MSNKTEPAAWLQRHLGDVAPTLWKDKVPIVLLTILLALAGFGAGSFLASNTRSRVHLVVAPMPATGDIDPVEIAPKMDITSIALLCTSDDVLRRTLDELNASGRLAKPIGDLRALSQSLSHQITVAKETPMEKLYTDILALTAKSRSPEDAALIVNAWAEEIIAAVDRYEDGIEIPMFEIFDKRFTQAKEALLTVEDEREQWYAANDMEFLTEQLNTLTEIVMNHLTDLSDIEAEYRFESAKAEGYQRAVDLLEPKLSVSWVVPDTAVSESLLSKLGVTSKPGQKPENTSKSSEPGSDETPMPTEGQPMLTQEKVNETYWDLYGELLVSRATAEGLDATRTRVEKQLADDLAEVERLNAEYRRMEKERERIERRYALAKEVHDVFYPRREWIEIARGVDYHTLQVLSGGMVWPRPHLFGLLGAAIMAGLGFCAAACGSLFLRLFVQPALKKPS